MNTATTLLIPYDAEPQQCLVAIVAVSDGGDR